jgi:hypothetical protein
MARAGQEHGNSTATTTISWQEHGWQEHEEHVWQDHGKNMAITWQEHCNIIAIITWQ